MLRYLSRLWRKDEPEPAVVDHSFWLTMALGRAEDTMRRAAHLDDAELYEKAGRAFDRIYQEIVWREAMNIPRSTPATIPRRPESPMKP